MERRRRGEEGGWNDAKEVRGSALCLIMSSHLITTYESSHHSSRHYHSSRTCPTTKELSQQLGPSCSIHVLKTWRAT